MSQLYTDISIDIETLGEIPGSIVAAVGLAAFDRRVIGRMGPTLVVRPSLSQQQEMGLRMTTGTFKWWLRQSEPARLEVADSIETGAVSALSSIRSFIDNNLCYMGTVWAKGPSFDFSILPAVARASQMPTPWKFPTERCVRTIADIAGIEHEKPSPGEAHTALGDALAQARTVQRAVAVLGDRSDPSRWLDAWPLPGDMGGVSTDGK